MICRRDCSSLEASEGDHIFLTSSCYRSFRAVLKSQTDYIQLTPVLRLKFEKKSIQRLINNATYSPP